MLHSKYFLHVFNVLFFTFSYLASQVDCKKKKKTIKWVSLNIKLYCTILIKLTFG